MFRILAAFSILLLTAVPVRAATINFDDLPETFDLPLPSLYQGLNWENFHYYSFDLNAGYPTWQAGIASTPNAAYSGGTISDVQIVATISSPTPFNFVSAYLGTVQYATMDLTVQGWLGGSLIFSQVAPVDSNGADLFTFNFTNIDTIRMFGSAGTPLPICEGSNCSQFSVDDLVIETAVPEPSTLSLLGLGVLALGRRLRSRKV